MRWLWVRVRGLPPDSALGNRIRVEAKLAEEQAKPSATAQMFVQMQQLAREVAE